MINRKLALLRSSNCFIRLKSNIAQSMAEATEKEDRPKKLPKKLYACLIGYCGTGYSGLQINDNAETIENEVFKALCKSGAIMEYNADDPKKSLKNRSARTDKGVHAATNVVTFKLTDLGDQAEKLINDCLPESIRLWKLVRTIGSFNPRHHCDSRIYEYLLPTYCFAPPSRTSMLGKSLISNFEPIESIDNESDRKSRRIFFEELQNIEDGLSLEHSTQSDNALIESIMKNLPEQTGAKQLIEMEGAIKRVIYLTKNYRLSQDKLDIVRLAFSKFVGLHNFHNYTLRKPYRDPSAMRRLYNITVSDPFQINNTEWVSIKLHGQSFMLHQIRKMVSMIMLVVRASSPLKLINETFFEQRLNIPKAPGLGLLLERPVFSSYDKKAKEFNRESIEEVFPKIEAQVNQFKKDKIYPHIYEEGEKTNLFHIYSLFVDNRMLVLTYYLTDKGIMPFAHDDHLVAIEDMMNECVELPNDD